MSRPKRELPTLNNASAFPSSPVHACSQITVEENKYLLKAGHSKREELPFSFPLATATNTRRQQSENVVLEIGLIIGGGPFSFRAVTKNVLP